MNEPPESTAPTTGRPWLLELRPPETGDESPAPPTVDPDGPAGLPPDTLGLALSGGGVRSAAFCLGALQALAKAGWLRHVDFLSTVSGGGFIGAFLGRCFDTRRGRAGDPELIPGAVQERVARELNDHDSTSVGWLRRRSNNVGPGDEAVDFAGFLRSLLTVHLVLGVSLFALFGLLNAASHSRTIVTLATRADDLIGGLAPLTRLLSESWSGPWLVLGEISLWLAAVPLMVAYWLVSQDSPESFIAAPLVAAAVVGAALTFLTGGPLPLAILAAAVLWAIGAWAAVRRTEGSADPNNPYRLSLVRDHLTRWLATWLGVTLVLATLGVIDGLGRWLASRMIEAGPTVQRVAAWLVLAGVALLGSAMFLRTAVLGRAGRRHLWTAAALLLGVGLPLVVLSFVSHASYEVGNAYARGLAITAVALVVSLLIGSRECVPLINRLGSMSIHAARLARHFLGAVNPARRQPLDGRESVAGDDAPLARYQPHLAGGPLHLINCAVDQTVDTASHRSDRDRHAENVAVGPVGMSVSRDWHAFWVDGRSPDRELEPLNVVGPDPFLSRAGGPVSAEPLSLQEWMAISGAAVGSGRGRRPGPKSSLVRTLANAFVGYWWDSGLDARDRVDSPVKTGPLTRLGGWLASLFRTQRLLLSELTGRFGGPWSRHWHLTDGGFFEATGAYELLRRRLPFVVICDAGEDLERRGSDLARLVRLARIDLGAEVTVVPPRPETLKALGVPDQTIDCLGSLDDLLAPAGEPSRKHAALLQVRHPESHAGPSSDPWLARRLTWVLYLKATRTGDEPADARSYAASHPDFPNETTLDQVFDEPQWESYRRLGEHIGESLFVPTTKGSP